MRVLLGAVNGQRKKDWSSEAASADNQDAVKRLPTPPGRPTGEPGPGVEPPAYCSPGPCHFPEVFGTSTSPVAQKVGSLPCP